MAQTFYQRQFYDSIVTALLFSSLSSNDKERKLQEFVNEAEERYDMLCDNITRLLANKETSSETNILYLTVDGFSFVSNFTFEQEPFCVPVLIINRYSPQCPDIAAYVEVALCHFTSYCTFAKNTYISFVENV